MFKDDPLVSLIVPVYGKTPEVLKRCLMSIADQDYKNLEVICVMDGPDKKLRKVCDFFEVENPKFKVIEMEHGGACKARNEGFKASKGEIISFTNSDYILKPGIIRVWVDTLLEHEDCGFAYGAYEMSTERRFVYWSKPFDPWLLEISNYIDCGFPLWRKHVVEWDENCKSLQDWDFWLRVVRNGVKGHYLGREISFVAEPPRRGGLSEDSSQNWIERVNYVKEKNGIPKRDLLVTSLGAPFHGVHLAQMLGADFRDDTIYKPNDYKALYMVGFYMKPNDGQNEHADIIRFYKDKGAKIIIHFVGADIYWLRKFPWESLKYLTGALTLSADYIICEDYQSQSDLKELGINAKIVPIPSYDNWERKPLPKDFSVGIYLVEKGNGKGQSDFDKYAYEYMLSIVRAMPDIQFHVYGEGGKDVDYPNMKHYGTMDRKRWKEFVYETSCLLRITRHDASAMASNEFIMAGRPVITNRPDPHMLYLDTSGDPKRNEWDIYGTGLNEYNWPKTKKKLVQMILDTQGKMASEEASLYYKKMLNRESYIQKIETLAGLREALHVA